MYSIGELKEYAQDKDFLEKRLDISLIKRAYINLIRLDFNTKEKVFLYLSS